VPTVQDKDIWILIDLAGFKQPFPAEQTREQPFLLDVQRNERREVGLRRRNPLTPGNGGAFENLGYRARIARAGEGRHW